LPAGCRTVSFDPGTARKGPSASDASAPVLLRYVSRRPKPLKFRPKPSVGRSRPAPPEPLPGRPAMSIGFESSEVQIAEAARTSAPDGASAWHSTRVSEEQIHTHISRDFLVRVGMDSGPIAYSRHECTSVVGKHSEDFLDAGIKPGKQFRVQF